MSSRIPQVSFSSWTPLFGVVLRSPKHVDLKVGKQMLPKLPIHFKKRLGDPDGQIEDYGYGLEDGRAIHVKEYVEYYKIHWDERDPSKDPLGHLFYDAPHWLIAILLVLVILVTVFFVLKKR